MLLFDLKPFHRAGATALLTLLLSACGGGNNDPAQGGELPNPPPPTSGSWQLVWEDDFDGASLDANSWDVQLAATAPLKVFLAGAITSFSTTKQVIFQSMMVC